MGFLLKVTKIVFPSTFLPFHFWITFKASLGDDISAKAIPLEFPYASLSKVHLKSLPSCLSNPINLYWGTFLGKPAIYILLLPNGLLIPKNLLLPLNRPLVPRAYPLAAFWALSNRLVFLFG